MLNTQRLCQSIPETRDYRRRPSRGEQTDVLGAFQILLTGAAHHPIPGWRSIQEGQQTLWCSGGERRSSSDSNSAPILLNCLASAPSDLFGSKTHLIPGLPISSPIASPASPAARDWPCCTTKMGQWTRPRFAMESETPGLRVADLE